ncbi:MAG: hypothetical protein ACT6FF_10270 [Methanosarcinaceae archaeon]
MKYLKIPILLLVFLLSRSAQSQTSEPENQLKLFYGGQTNIEFSLYSSLLFGLGPEAGTSQKSNSLSGFGIHGLSTNPAHLSFINRRQIMFDLAPGFSIPVNNFYDVDAAIQEQVDNAIINFRTADTELIYPKVSIRAGQNGGFSAGAVVVPFKQNWVVGASISQPFFLNLNMLGNGIQALLTTEKDMGGKITTIRLRTNIDLSLVTNINLQTTNLVVARNWNKKISTGLALNFHQIHLFGDGNAQIDGIMETAGTEYAFNDPYDKRIDFENGEQNDLNQSFQADFYGTGWGVKAGGTYRLHHNFLIDLLIDISPEIALKGEMEVIQYKIPALNVEAMSDDTGEMEIMDPLKMNLAKLTLTESVVNPTDDKVILKLPSSIAVGGHYRLGFLKGAVYLRSYFNEFSFTFIEAQRGLKLKYGLRLAFDFNYFTLSGGFLAGDEILEGFADEGMSAQTGVLIPQFSMGAGFHFLQRYRLDTILLALPAPILRTSILMEF